MKYLVHVKDLAHLSKIVKNLSDESMRRIYFTSYRGNVFVTALNGHIMPLYKISTKKVTEEFTISFSYNDVFESYLKACKKNILVYFNSDTKTLDFLVGNTTLTLNETSDVYNSIDINHIIEKGFNVIKSPNFNITPATSRVTLTTMENIFPSKNGTITFYGDTEKLNDVMIARYSEDKEFCALVMPMVLDDEETHKEFVEDINNYFIMSDED